MSGRHRVEILVAACEGSIKLACSVGLPIVHVDAVVNGRMALAHLNANAHGSGVRVDAAAAPIALVQGWSRWRRFPVFEEGTAAHASGVSVSPRGRIQVVLPPEVPLSEFREQLHGALRHLRLQDVASGVQYLRVRGAGRVHRCVQPRYTPFGACGIDLRLVTDLYVLDPTSQSWRLLWIVAAARLAALQGCTPRWR